MAPFPDNVRPATTPPGAGVRRVREVLEEADHNRRQEHLAYRQDAAIFTDLASFTKVKSELTAPGWERQLFGG